MVGFCLLAINFVCLSSLQIWANGVSHTPGVNWRKIVEFLPAVTADGTEDGFAFEMSDNVADTIAEKAKAKRDGSDKDCLMLVINEWIDGKGGSDLSATCGMLATRLGWKVKLPNSSKYFEMTCPHCREKR